MKKYLLALSAVLFLAGPLSADCPKCERIRQYNREHPENNYEYYDEYLKELDNNSEDSASVDEGISAADETSYVFEDVE